MRSQRSQSYTYYCNLAGFDFGPYSPSFTCRAVFDAVLKQTMEALAAEQQTCPVIAALVAKLCRLGHASLVAKHVLSTVSRAALLPEASGKAPAVPSPSAQQLVARVSDLIR